MDKLLKVVNSARTLLQLKSASNYIVLYANMYGTNGVYYDAMVALREKLEVLTGACTRNLLDYKAYASHLLQNGMIDDAKDFIAFAELELHNLEEFVKEVR